MGWGWREGGAELRPKNTRLLLAGRACLVPLRRRLRAKLSRPREYLVRRGRRGPEGHDPGHTVSWGRVGPESGLCTAKSTPSPSGRGRELLHYVEESSVQSPNTSILLVRSS